MSLLAENCIVKDGCLPRGGSLMDVPKGAVVQCLAHSRCPEIRVPATGRNGRSRLMGTGRGGGCSPSRRAWLGGLLPEGPCGSPPNTKEAAAAGLK